MLLFALSPKWNCDSAIPQICKKETEFSTVCPNVEKGGRDCYRSTAGIEPPSTCGLTARQQVEEKVGGEG